MHNEALGMTRTERPAGHLYPAFIETDKMLEHLAQVTKDVEKRAFEIFRERGFDWGDQLDDWFRAESEVFRPTPVEITESGNVVNVRAEVAGFTPDEITYSLNGNIMILCGNSGTELKSEDESVLYSERKSGRFYRRLELPTEVDPESVETQLADGILTISLRKKKGDELTSAAVA